MRRCHPRMPVAVYEVVGVVRGLRSAGAREALAARALPIAQRRGRADRFVSLLFLWWLSQGGLWRGGPSAGSEDKRAGEGRGRGRGEGHVRRGTVRERAALRRALSARPRAVPSEAQWRTNITDFLAWRGGGGGHTNGEGAGIRCGTGCGRRGTLFQRARGFAERAVRAESGALCSPVPQCRTNKTDFDLLRPLHRSPPSAGCGDIRTGKGRGFVEKPGRVRRATHG